MPRLLYHLWWHVLSTSTKTISNLSTAQSHLGQSKICNFHVSIVVDEQILRFEIAIYDVLLMQIHKPVEYFYEIEASVFFIHAFDSLQVVEQLSSRAICIDKLIQSSTKQTKLCVSKQ